MVRERRIGYPRALAASLLVLGSIGAALGLSGCTADMQANHEVMRGITPCRCDNCDSWRAYRGVLRGENPCGCSDSCSPCAPACPPPCAPRCSSIPASGAPPYGKPGEGWCRVYTPPVYETKTEFVTTECTRTQQVWVPPVYRTDVHRIEVEPENYSQLPVDGATRSVVSCCEKCPARTYTRTHCETDSCGCPHEVTETCLVPAETCYHRSEVPVLAPRCHDLWEPAKYSAELCDVEECPGHWATITVPPIRERVTSRICKSPESWTWKRNDRCAVPAAPPPACSPVPTARPVPAPMPAPAPMPPPAVSAPAPVAPKAAPVK